MAEDPLEQSPEQLEQIKAKILEIKQLAAELGMLENINFENLQKNLPLLDKVLGNLRAQAGTWKNLKSTTDQFSAILDKVKDTDLVSDTTLSSFKNISDLSKQILQSNTETIASTITEAQSLRQIIEEDVQRLETQQQTLQATEKIRKLTGEEELKLKNIKDLLTGIKGLFAGQQSAINNIVSSTEEYQSRKAEISKNIASSLNTERNITSEIDNQVKKKEEVNNVVSTTLGTEKNLTSEAKARSQVEPQTSTGQANVAAAAEKPAAKTTPQNLGTVSKAYSPEELTSLYEQLLQLAKQTNKVFSQTTLDALKKDGPALESQIKGLQKEVDDLSSRSFSSVSETLRSIVNDLSQSNKETKAISSSFNKLESISRSLQYDQEGIAQLNEKELKQFKEKIEIQISDLKFNRQQLLTQAGLTKEEVKFNQLSKQEQETLIRKSSLTEKQKDQLVEMQSIFEGIGEEAKLITNDNKENINVVSQLQQLAKQRLETEQEIRKRLGLTGKAVEGITNALGKLGFKSKYFEDLDEKLKSVAKKSAEVDGVWQGRWKVALTGILGIFKGIFKALADPLFLMTGAIAAFKSLVELGMHHSELLADMQKSYGITADQARELLHYSEETAVSSANELATTKNRIEAQNQLNEAYGTTAILSTELVDNQIDLTKKLGLSGEEASKLSMYAVQYGKTQNDILKNVGKENKGLFSNKKVLQEVLKVEGQLAASYKNDPALITKAVVQAQKLGISLQQAQNMSSKLLDFESSIQAQMEAQVLTGEQLDLTRARSLALQGKSAEAAQEMLTQVGGLTKFENMNVIQRQALAEAMGMSADELADSLKKQTQINKLTIAQRTEIEKLRKEGKGDLADQIEQGIYQGKSFDLSKQQASVQERFAAAMERLKDVVATQLAPAFEKMLSGMTSFLPKLKSALTFILDIGKGIASATSAFVGFLGKIGDIPVLGDALKKFAAIGTILYGVRALGDFAKTLKYGQRGASVKNPLFVELVQQSLGFYGRQKQGPGARPGPSTSPTRGGKPGSKFSRLRKFAGKGRAGKILAGLGGIASFLGATGLGGDIVSEMTGGEEEENIESLIPGGESFQAAGPEVTPTTTAQPAPTVTSPQTPGAKPITAPAPAASTKSMAQQVEAVKRASPKPISTPEAIRQIRANTATPTPSVASTATVAEEAAAGGGFFSKVGGLFGRAKQFVKKLSPFEWLKKLFQTKGKDVFAKLAKIPVLNIFLEGIFANSDIKDMIADKDPETGKFTVGDDDLAKEVGKRAFQGIGGILGSIGGAALGTAIGAPFLGSLVGDVAIRSLTGLLSDYIGGPALGGMILKMYPDELKEAGRAVPTTTSIPAEEMPKQAPALAVGGVVTREGIAKVDTGEVYLGRNTQQTLRDMVETLRQHTAILAAIRDKELSVSMDKLAYATAKTTRMSYGNPGNPDSRLK